MAYEHRAYPELTWSMSRHNKMAECLLQYYYYYYQAHNGWERTTTLERRQAYLQKQLTNMYKLFGESLHTMAESSLKQFIANKKVPREEILNNGIRNMLNTGYQHSMTKRKEWELRPKDYYMLEEIYYDGGLREHVTKSIADRRPKCVGNFLECKTIKEVTTREVEFLEIEQLNDHILYDVKNYVKIDLMYRVGSESAGIYRIVDWKTGAEDNDKSFDQMLTYVIYALAKYSVDIEQVEIRVEYLLTGNCESHFVYREDVEYAREQIRLSIEGMKSLCENSDINQPKDIMSFIPCVSNKCRTCQFRGICPYESTGL
jgi:hypothetical protein